MFYTLNYGVKCVFLALKFTLNFAPRKHVFLALFFRLGHGMVRRAPYIYNMYI